MKGSSSFWNWTLFSPYRSVLFFIATPCQYVKQRPRGMCKSFTLLHDYNFLLQTVSRIFTSAIIFPGAPVMEGFNWNRLNPARKSPVINVRCLPSMKSDYQPFPLLARTTCWRDRMTSLAVHASHIVPKQYTNHESKYSETSANGHLPIADTSQ